jgi:hypothetical protein
MDDFQMTDRIRALLRRQREIEALQEELSREMRAITRELTERRSDTLAEQFVDAGRWPNL